ncbi:hypothetical protein OZX58_00505 [Lactobacillus sp. ESL0680]|uniref:hypothetical protein n=1 Tax=Lactobacillus sp. ESL0680 TaxID=2983210 RepID=UPI0023F9C729|nr:hypothetical protein [Lactobacillus sp. ESL0680]WEV38786.1 hypothetical protein OZX58_00505 [Lactobacillus sp. ESL0680]
MREAILNPKGYKFAWLITIIVLLGILIIPWFKLFDFSVSLIGTYLMLLVDPLATFFQKHRIIGPIAILLAFALGMITSAILFFYAMWASGRVEFVK